MLPSFSEWRRPTTLSLQWSPLDSEQIVMSRLQQEGKRDCYQTPFVEVIRPLGHIDGSSNENDLEVVTKCQKLYLFPNEDIDAECSLMDSINDNDGAVFQERIPLHSSQPFILTVLQHTSTSLLFSNGQSHLNSQFDVHFIGYSHCKRDSRQSRGLRAHNGFPSDQVNDPLGNLSALPWTQTAIDENARTAEESLFEEIFDLVDGKKGTLFGQLEVSCRKRIWSERINFGMRSGFHPEVRECERIFELEGADQKKNTIKVQTALENISRSFSKLFVLWKV